MSSRNAANFCAQCGAGLGSGATYCSQCGVAAGSSGIGATGARSGFRQRIEELTVEGWEVQHDYGDHAVLVDRGIGSIGIHVLLLLFTGGFGNLLYGWYSYSMNAERIELHSDGTRRWLNQRETIDVDTDWAFSAVAAMFLLFFGLMFLISGSSAATFAVGLACLVGGGLVLPPVRRRLAPQKPIGTFGRVRDVDERVVERPQTPCAACAAPVEQGVERSYGTRTYVAGVPIHTHEQGKNAYCRSCASGDSFDEEPATEPATQRETA